MFKRSWKTTLAGIITAIGVGVSNHPNPILQWIGQGLTIVGSILMGASAKDVGVE